MGKIVKFCSSCDEGFAEKFAFCPNCGTSLQAFEMKPVEAEVIPEQAEPEPIEAEIFATPMAEFEPETVQTAAAVDEFPEPVEATPEPVEPITAAPIPEATAYVPETVTVPAASSVFVQTKAVDVDYIPTKLEAEREAYTSDGGFYVTVIEEKNVKQRNVLLLGTCGFMIVALITGTVYSLFAKDLRVGAIGSDDMFVANLIDDVPMVTEEEKKKDKDSGGGGGGGGREEKEEVNRGDLANQTANPQRPPEALLRYNTDMPLPTASTQGTMKFDQKYNVYGDPNGRFDNLSNGPGTGGGMGSGRGTGQGSGNGTGAGSGNGSGYGGGNGNGNGNGTGEGGDVPPPPKHVGVTQDLRILSKPRPGYTDAARQANIQGTVILRVVFTASGQVGSISTIKGLPSGLTEKAMEAARRISFEPKKIDGVGQSVTKQIEYTFSIY